MKTGTLGIAAFALLAFAALGMSPSNTHAHATQPAAGSPAGKHHHAAAQGCDMNTQCCYSDGTLDTDPDPIGGIGCDQTDEGQCPGNYENC